MAVARHGSNGEDGETGETHIVGGSAESALLMLEIRNSRMGCGVVEAAPRKRKP